jgi:DNA-binding NarL/FixJ family response regulator
MLGEALATFLAAADDLRVIATLRIEHGLAERVAGLRPDVVVLDLGDGPSRVGVAVRSIVTAAPSAAVVVVSGDPDLAAAVEAAYAGANGWVAKTGSLEDLIGAIRAVRDGHGWYPEEQVGALLRALRGSTAGVPPPLGLPAALSPRESEVLRHLLAGSRDSEIAASMGLSLPTVRTHVRNLLRKLGVHSRVDAARMAAAAGWRPVQPDRPRPAR